MDSTLNKSLLGSSPEIAASGASSEPPKRKVKLYTTSVFIVAYVIFAIAASSGLLICALWPLCNHLGGSKIELGKTTVCLFGRRLRKFRLCSFCSGLLVGIHAVGKAAMAQPMVTLTEKYKHGHALFVGMLLLFVGSLLWAFCPVLGGIAMLYIAQFVLGASCAAMGTARAFIVEQTRPNRRTYVLGRILALDYGGHFVVPIFGVLFIGLGDTMSTFMKFALPALVLSILGAVALYLLYFHFQDIREEDEMTEADFNPISKQVVSVTPPRAASPPSPVTTYRSPDIEQSSSEAYVPPSPTSSVSSASAGRPTSPSSSAPSTSAPPALPAPAPVSATTPSTAVTHSPSDEQAHQEVYQLVMLMNFALRSVMAVYATLVTEIILNGFELSFYALGGILSGAGELLLNAAFYALRL
jgi:MFS family permease